MEKSQVALEMKTLLVVTAGTSGEARGPGRREGHGAGLLSPPRPLSRTVPSPVVLRALSHAAAWDLPEGTLAPALGGCPWPIARSDVPPGGCAPGAKADQIVPLGPPGAPLSSHRNIFSLFLYLIFTRSM